MLFPGRCLSSKIFSRGSAFAPRILITGGLGQLGKELSKLLRSHYGAENVILSDIVKPTLRSQFEYKPYIYLDILQTPQLEEVIVNHDIDCIVHFSALLSAIAEGNVEKALAINIDGLHNVFNVATKYELRLFVPSTIGVFGPSSPRIQTPNVTIQRPNTVYGVTKVYCELLGEYYHQKYNLDFRCLRLPGIISADKPGGGTTDYSIKMLHDAIDSGSHECYLKPTTRLPMMYIDDCLGAILKYKTCKASAKIESDGVASVLNENQNNDTPFGLSYIFRSELLEACKLPTNSRVSFNELYKLKLLETSEGILQSTRTYNIAAFSVTPEELINEIRLRIPQFHVSYNICPMRQNIAESWPESLDDSEARKDWNWAHKFDLSRTVDRMLQVLQEDKAHVTTHVG